MVDAKPRLETTRGGQPEAAELTSAIAEIKTELTIVSAANLEPDGSTNAEIAAVDGAVQDAQNAVTQVETEVDTTPSVVEAPSSSPVTDSPSTEASQSESASPVASAAPSQPADATASPGP